MDNFLNAYDIEYNNLLISKKGLRCYSGGGSPPPPPPVVEPETKLTEAEKGRIGRYEKDVKAFEDIYKQIPSYFGDYTGDIKELYPGRREKATELEGQVYDYLPQVNVLSDQFREQADRSYDIRKEQQLEAFNEMYNPIERQITGKAFGKYGGMESSAHRDLQTRLADERTEGLSNIVNQLDLQRQQQEAQQLALQQQGLQGLMQGYNLANVGVQEFPAVMGTASQLGGGGMAMYGDLIAAMQSKATQGAALANQYNLANYQQQLAAQQQQQSNAMGMWGAGLSGVGALI